MPLTDVQIRNTKPQEKPCKLTDGGVPGSNDCRIPEETGRSKGFA